MYSVSVSMLQRQMNEVIMPMILAGETIQVIDKKTGEAKFNIVPPSEESRIEWPDLEARAIKLKNHDSPVIDNVLDVVREDRDFSALL